MEIRIRQAQENDTAALSAIWNEVIEDGEAFPQFELLDADSGWNFFRAQTYVGVAEGENGQLLGLYILHPNNVGRCGHIANASFAVRRGDRGQHIGEALVRDCLEKGRQFGFRLMQFNAVVASNVHARHLYERLGFQPIGTVPEGFRMKDGHYEDICLYYRVL